MKRSSSRKASSPASALALAVHEMLRRIRFEDVDAVGCNGITRTECHVLEVVALHGPLSLNAVTDHMQLNKSSVSRVIDSLAVKKLVLTEAAVDDGRKLSITVTAKGHRIWKAIVNATTRRYAEILSECTPAEQKAVIRIVSRIAAQS